MSARLSFNAWNHSSQWGLPPSLPAQIEAAAACGYDHVGLDIPSLAAHERDGLAPEAIADLLQEHGISCYELVPLWLSADREAADASLAVAMRAARALGAQQLLGVVQGPIDDDVVANTRRAVSALADQGVGTAVEFMPTLPVSSIDEVLRLADLVGHPALTADVDTWHFFRGPSTWESFDRLPLDRLGFVQFSDGVEPISDDVQNEYRQRRVLPGEGLFDLTRFCDVLRAKGFDGVVSVEVLSAAWRDRPPAELVAASMAATRKFW